MKKIYGYARVSTKEQHLDRQIKALLDHGIDERDIVSDHASGASLERPGYAALKSTMLRDGDTLVVKSLDRLSRNKEHIIQELQYFKNRHIKIQVLDLPTTMIDLPEGQQWVFDMINNILIEVLASIAEQERLTIKQRQAEGIAVDIKKRRLLKSKPPFHRRVKMRLLHDGFFLLPSSGRILFIFDDLCKNEWSLLSKWVFQ